MCNTIQWSSFISKLQKKSTKDPKSQWFQGDLPVVICSETSFIGEAYRMKVPCLAIEGDLNKGRLESYQERVPASDVDITMSDD